MLHKDSILQEILPEVLHAHQTHSPDPLSDTMQIIAEKSDLILRNQEPHVLVCLQSLAGGHEEYMLVHYGETPTAARMLDYWYLSPLQAQRIQQQIG